MKLGRILILVSCIVLLECGTAGIRDVPIKTLKGERVALVLGKPPKIFKSFATFNKDNELLLLCASEKDRNKVCIIDLINNTYTEFSKQPNEKNFGFCITEKGKYLYLTSGNDYLQITDMVSSNIIRKFPVGDFKKRVALSRSGRLLLISDDDKKNNVTIWDVASGKCVNTIPHWPRNIEFSSSDNKIIISKYIGPVLVWDLQKNLCIYKDDPPNVVTDIIFSSNDNMIAVGYGHSVLLQVSRCTMFLLPFYTFESSIEIININTNQKIKVVGHNEKINTLIFSNNDMVLASGDWGGYVKLWDTGSGKLLHTFKMNKSISRIVFSRDDKFVVIHDYNSIIKLWEVKSGKLLATMTTYGEKGWVIVTPDGRYDGNEEGLKHLHWKVNDKNIPLDKFGREYYKKGLIKEILKNDKR